MPGHHDIQVFRKAFHIFSSCLFALVYYIFFDHNEIQAIAIFCFIFLIGFEYIKINQAKKKNYYYLMSLFYRKKEFTGISSLFFAGIAFLIIIFLCPKEAVIFALLTLGFCDPLANYFGVIYGRTKLCERKTLEGSMAFFFGSILVAITTTSLFNLNQDSFLYLILIGFLTTLTELVSVKIEDSLTIPIISSFLYTILIV
jgi:dolichol kinase